MIIRPYIYVIINYLSIVYHHAFGLVANLDNVIFQYHKFVMVLIIKQKGKNVIFNF